MHVQNELCMRYLYGFWFHLSLSDQFGLLDGAFRKFLDYLIFQVYSKTPTISGGPSTTYLYHARAPYGSKAAEIQKCARSF